MTTRKIYEPSDDSFLLLDSVKNLKCEVAVDVGTGTGFIAINIVQNCNFVIGTDIDINSIKEAKNIVRNKRVHNIDFIVCDLATALRDSSVNLVIFNPPYLPSDEYKTDIDIQTLQFYDKNDIIVRFIIDARRILARNGSCYMVYSSLTDTREMMRIAPVLFNSVKVIAEKTLFFETLYVIEFSLDEHAITRS